MSVVVPKPLQISLVVTGAWALVALLFAAQGYGIARYRGSPQPWWPSVGYAFAIFAVWAVLTPVVVAATRRTAQFNRLGRLFALIAGLPLTGGLHVALFALAFWPVYNGDGRLPTRRAMAEHMALRNLDTNALFYLLVVGCALWWEARSRRAAALCVSDRPSAGSGRVPVRVRGHGRLHLIPPAEIDWAAAAGDYVELHVGADIHLADGPLSALERALPADEFARIHRAVLVQIDRIVEVRGIGRGDAMVRLATGAELRLSRRYRTNLAALLQSTEGADPIRRPARSRSPNRGGGSG